MRVVTYFLINGVRVTPSPNQIPPPPPHTHTILNGQVSEIWDFYPKFYAIVRVGLRIVGSPPLALLIPSHYSPPITPIDYSLRRTSNPTHYSLLITSY